MRDAGDLADLLRMGRLPEAWIAPPATRELRELVRYRAKLVAIRSGLKAQVHAVLAKAGVLIAVSDLFGVGGRQRLGAKVPLGSAYAERVRSLLELIDVLDSHQARFAGLIAKRLDAHRGYQAIQQVPGIGPTLAAPTTAVASLDHGRAHRLRSASGPAVSASAYGRVVGVHHRCPTGGHRGVADVPDAVARDRDRATLPGVSPAHSRRPAQFRSAHPAGLVPQRSRCRGPAANPVDLPGPSRLGGMVGRESDGAVQRIGLRPRC